MQGVIYKIFNSVNDKIYIGQTVNFKERIKAHRKSKATCLIATAFREIGKDNFKFSIIEKIVSTSQEELSVLLLDRERHYIKIFESYQNGYNQTIGGLGTRGLKLREQFRQLQSEKRKGVGNSFFGKVHSEKTKIQLSIKAKSRPSRMKGKHHTEDTKSRLKETHTGENSWWFGKKHSEHTKEKIRLTKIGKPGAMLGRKVSDETKRKLVEKLTGKKRSEASLIRIREAAKNRIKPLSASENCKKKIFIGDVEYKSQTDASKILNIPIPTICWRLRNNKMGYRYAS